MFLWVFTYRHKELLEGVSLTNLNRVIWVDFQEKMWDKKKKVCSDIKLKSGNKNAHVEKFKHRKKEMKIKTEEITVEFGLTVKPDLMIKHLI